MEVPNAYAPSEAGTIPSTIVTEASDELLRAVVDNDVSKKGKRMNYQFWEIAAIVYGCHAAYVANRSLRSSFAVNTFAITTINLRSNAWLARYGLKEGHGGTHIVA